MKTWIALVAVSFALQITGLNSFAEEAKTADAKVAKKEECKHCKRHHGKNKKDCDCPEKDKEEAAKGE